MRAGYVVVLAATVLLGCSDEEEAPSASWCSEIEPVVAAGPMRGSLESIEITGENAEHVASDSAELRSRVAVLVSTAPERLRADVDLVLNGSATGDLDAVDAARDAVRSYVEGRC